MIRLNEANLRYLPAGIARPLYNRSDTRTGIVHLGLGAFHRAHQAEFTDDCLNAGETNWGIAAASLRNPDTRDALAPQDGLYTLALRENADQALRVIGAINQTFVAPEDPGALLRVMADPAVKIVSLTVTEKGYTADIAGGGLQLSDQGVQHDLAHPDSPRTVLGFVAQSLAMRRAAGIKPFTLLSCDNLPDNGHFLHRVLGQFAASRDADFGRYIMDEIACPTCMVDRIVPATTDADRDMVSARLGMRDACPVMAEPYFQWVIEDHFPTGRPQWERAGVVFANDIGTYEAMKLRLLNGAHTAIAAMGGVSGYATVADAFGNPVIRAFIAAYWAEVAPTIAPGTDVAGYTARLMTRFDNTALHHKTAQIATDASLKVPQRIVAPLRDLVAMGRPTPMLCFALAAWIRSCQGTDEAGGTMPISDPQLQGWKGLPASDVPVADTVRAYLSLSSVFGLDLSEYLAPALETALADIRDFGVLAAAQMRLAAKP